MKTYEIGSVQNDKFWALRIQAEDFEFIPGKASFFIKEETVAVFINPTYVCETRIIQPAPPKTTTQ